MPKINTYQRRRLASSVVGAAPQDTSGQIIGRSIVGLGAQLSKRQEALDTAAVATAFYQYTEGSNLVAMGLRKKFQGDSNLDPLTFNTKYQASAVALATKMKEEMPARLHGKFDALVAKTNANQTIANNKWAFAQQNQNALQDFQELSLQSAIMAGNYMNTEDFMDGRKIYLETAKNYETLMTANSYAAATKVALKQRAAMYWNNSVDFRNGGDPAAFATALETDPKLRNTLQEDLGPKEFKSLEGKLNTFIRQMGAHNGFLKLTQDNADLSKKVKKLWDPENDYGLKQVSDELTQAVNQRNYLTSINNKGQYDEVLSQAEANILNLQTLKRIAGNVNDTSYASDPQKKAELLAEIRVAMLPFGKANFKDKLAGVKKDIAKQTAGQDTKRPWWHLLSGVVATRVAIEEGTAMITGVPSGVRAEKREKIVASESLSKYIETAQTLKGKVLQGIDTKQLTYKDGMKLISTIGMAINVNQYDALKAQKANWFTEGYSAFSDYARDLNLFAGSVEANRRLRDDIKTQMMDDYTSRIATIQELGVEVTPTKRAEIIGMVKREKSMQLHPEFMGVEPGEYVTTASGRSVKFVGFGGTNGTVQGEAKGLQKAVGNL